MAAGDLRADAPMLVVGFRALQATSTPPSSPTTCRAAGVPARVGACIDRRVDGRPEANSLGLARAFDDPELARR